MGGMIINHRSAPPCVCLPVSFVNEGTCVDFLSLFFIVIQGHVADLKIKLTLVRLHFNSTPRGNPESGSPVQVCCLSLLPMASADPRLWDLNRGLHMVFA